MFSKKIFPYKVVVKIKSSHTTGSATHHFRTYTEAKKFAGSKHKIVKK